VKKRKEFDIICAWCVEVIITEEEMGRKHRKVKDTRALELITIIQPSASQDALSKFARAMDCTTKSDELHLLRFPLPPTGVDQLDMNA
jgi:hypothetical protein